LLILDETDVEIEIKKIDIDQVDNCLLTSNDEETDAQTTSDNKSDETNMLTSSVQVDSYAVFVLFILSIVRIRFTRKLLTSLLLS